MKRILITAMLALIFVTGFASALYPDYKNLMEGRVMVPYGAPWISDDDHLYLGTGKDFDISYDSSEDKVYLNNTALYFEEDATFNGNVGVNGTLVDNGDVDGTVNISSTLKAQSVWSNTTLSADTNLVVDNTAKIGGATTVASLSSNATVAATTALTGADVVVTDDAFIGDDGAIDGALRVDETLTANAGVFNTTLGGHGAAKFDNNVQVEDALSGGTLLVNRTSVLTGVTTIGLTNQSTVLQQSNVTLTSQTAKRMYRLKPTSAHVGLTIVLPPAAEMNNTVVSFVNELAVSNDCHVTLDGSGAETINGAATKYCTAKYAFITLYCIDGEWIILDSMDTWT